MSDGPYLFDVGVIALAHSQAPVADAALSYIRQAVAGEINVVVPTTAVIGAHNVLTTHYDISNRRASELMQNFTSAQRIDWYGDLSHEVVSAGFSLAAEHNIDGWDGYYATVARETGVGTLLTIDDDFDSIPEFETTIILSPEQFATLNDYLGY